MPRRKNGDGYCDERALDRQELNLCDYFHSKRKNSKPCCRNCVHFHLLEKSTKIDRVSNDNN